MFVLSSKAIEHTPPLFGMIGQTSLEHQLDYLWETIICFDDRPSAKFDVCHVLDMLDLMGAFELAYILDTYFL